MAFRNILNRFQKQKDKQIPKAKSVKDRFEALKNLPDFFSLIWEVSPKLIISSCLLRLIKAAFPLLILYTGKIILDAILNIINTKAGAHFENLWKWVALELALVVISEGLSRIIALLDGLLGDLFANSTSIKLMQHASVLDLEQFEDAQFYDKLERARRQTIGRTVLMAQVLGQLQDALSLIFLAGGLIAFNPWLIVLLAIAVIPAFLGEAHFNEKTYSLVHGWTPQRRELDYLRFIGASDETAKEIKIFGLADFLITRFKELSDQYFNENKIISVTRAAYSSILSIFAGLGYYGAYVFIILQTINGKLSPGEMTFLAGSFARMRMLLESMLARLSGIVEGALYLRDLFDFLDLKPRIDRSKKGLRVP
ncbi:MAG TPA: ABC transporter ATP-binding protein, partial [Cytophagaceae bacterium]